MEWDKGHSLCVSDVSNIFPNMTGNYINRMRKLTE